MSDITDNSASLKLIDCYYRQFSNFKANRVLLETIQHFKTSLSVIIDYFKQPECCIRQLGILKLFDCYYGHSAFLKLMGEIIDNSAFLKRTECYYR